MGYRIHVLDPDPGCPARFVVDQCVEADWTDAARSRPPRPRLRRRHARDRADLARQHGRRRAASRRCAPASAMLAVIQDRIEQKNWLGATASPSATTAPSASLDDLRAAVAALGGKCFCKSATGGYDGRGQGKVGFAANHLRARTPNSRARRRGRRSARAPAWSSRPSISTAKSPSWSRARRAAKSKSIPPRGTTTRIRSSPGASSPRRCPTALAAEAKELAETIAATFQLEGILAVELFVTKDCRLLVNELAPRPHNSYHASERACVTSQFEQLVRAVCNLPLGSTRRRPALRHRQPARRPLAHARRTRREAHPARPALRPRPRRPRRPPAPLRKTPPPQRPQDGPPQRRRRHPRRSGGELVLKAKSLL